MDFLKKTLSDAGEKAAQEAMVDQASNAIKGAFGGDNAKLVDQASSFVKQSLNNNGNSSTQTTQKTESTFLNQPRSLSSRLLPRRPPPLTTTTTTTITTITTTTTTTTTMVTMRAISRFRRRPPSRLTTLTRVSPWLRRRSSRSLLTSRTRRLTKRLRVLFVPVLRSTLVLTTTPTTPTTTTTKLVL